MLRLAADHQARAALGRFTFGLIDTRLTQPGATGLPPETLDRLRGMVPLGRAGTPEEAAGSIYLMCIPESDYVSGQVLLVAGGMSL